MEISGANWAEIVQAVTGLAAFFLALPVLKLAWDWFRNRFEATIVPIDMDPISQCQRWQILITNNSTKLRDFSATIFPPSAGVFAIYASPVSRNDGGIKLGNIDMDDGAVNLNISRIASKRTFAVNIITSKPDTPIIFSSSHKTKVIIDTRYVNFYWSTNILLYSARVRLAILSMYFLAASIIIMLRLIFLLVAG